MRVFAGLPLVTPLLLTACAQSNSNNDCQIGDAFQGCWISERCEQLTTIGGTPVLRWGKTRYQFSVSGELTSTGDAYDNANCAGTITQSDPAVGSSAFPALEFEVLGTETANNGLPAWRAHWYWPIPSGQTLDGEGRVQLTNARLCLPSWLLLGATKAGFDAGTSADIDYSYGRCLIRQ